MAMAFEKTMLRDALHSVFVITACRTTYLGEGVGTFRCAHACACVCVSCFALLMPTKHNTSIPWHWQPQQSLSDTVAPAMMITILPSPNIFCL
jgi:hypothetical protein